MLLRSLAQSLQLTKVVGMLGGLAMGSTLVCDILAPLQIFVLTYLFFRP